jgi:signal transduction histidine kinase
MEEEKKSIFRHDIKNRLMSFEYARILCEEGFSPEYMNIIITQSEESVRTLNEGGFDIRGRIRCISGVLETVQKEETENQEILCKMIVACKEILKMLELVRVCQDVHKPRKMVLDQIITDLENVTDVNISTDKSLLVFEGDCLFPQVLSNLVHNAILHGHANRVSFTTCKKVFKGDDYIVVAVEDNGSGIPKSVKGRIFQKGITSRINGKGGDGLFLVRHILKLSGILIKETSKLGHGARFEIMVPYSNVFCYKENIS